MGTNEYREPLHFQYLGDEGMTLYCVNAMVAILTSPFPPSSITAIFHEMAKDDTSTSVCFIVWGWPEHEHMPTIIPDGFGTHTGTGGRGFAAVLDMIQLYGIPLQEYWADREQFRRIAQGYPLEEDFQQIQQGAKPISYRNQMSLSEFDKQLWHDEPMITMRTPVPYWMIESEIRDDAKEIEHSPSHAVFQAARRLEVILRTTCQLPELVTGELLLHQALGEGKPLKLKGATTYETESWFRLFQGVIGAFKEPHNQREQPLTRDDALTQILTINLLLRKLKQDHPDKFPIASHKRKR